MKPLVEVNTNLQKTLVLFSEDNMLIADYDLCSVSSSFFSHSQLTFVLSFSSSFIHTKAWVTSLKSQWSSELQSLSLSSHLIQWPPSICRRLTPRMPVDTKNHGCSSPLQSTLQTQNLHMLRANCILSPSDKTQNFQPGIQFPPSILLQTTFPTVSLLWYLSAQPRAVWWP